jgi:hypothetical protein
MAIKRIYRVFNTIVRDIEAEDPHKAMENFDSGKLIKDEMRSVGVVVNGRLKHTRMKE